MTILQRFSEFEIGTNEERGNSFGFRAPSSFAVVNGPDLFSLPSCSLFTSSWSPFAVHLVHARRSPGSCSSFTWLVVTLRSPGSRSPSWSCSVRLVCARRRAHHCCSWSCRCHSWSRCLCGVRLLFTIGLHKTLTSLRKNIGEEMVLLLLLARGLCVWREYEASCLICGGNNNLMLLLGFSYFQGPISFNTSKPKWKRGLYFLYFIHFQFVVLCMYHVSYRKRYFKRFFNTVLTIGRIFKKINKCYKFS